MASDGKEPAAEGKGAESGAAPVSTAVPKRKGFRGRPLALQPSLSITHNSTRILDWVVLGGAEACSEFSQLEVLGVTHVLNVTTERECKNHYPEHFTYKRIPVSDKPEEAIRPFFEEADDFMNIARSAGKSVLVHCQSGMSRSAAFVLAHMMRSLKMSLAAAIAHTRERRKRAAPNSGFFGQLAAYEEELTGKITVDVDKYATHRFDPVENFIVGPVPKPRGSSGLTDSPPDKAWNGDAGGGRDGARVEASPLSLGLGASGDVVAEDDGEGEGAGAGTGAGGGGKSDER